MVLSLLHYKTYHWLPSDRQEQHCQFISSRGLAKSCQCRNQLLRSSSPVVEPDLLAPHQLNGTIYLCTDALANFVDHQLLHTRAPFVLVTGDSDTSIQRSKCPAAALSNRQLNVLLEHPLLTAWYAQNLAAEHPKLHNLPIGLDYHTLTARRSHPWGAFQTPLEQEETLRQLMRSAQTLASRKLQAYCNWHHAAHRGDRTQVIETVQPDLAYYEPAHLPRLQSWQKNTQFLFTLSPFGEGMDCHRTWEALFLGSAPIVRKTSLAPLFEGLPVVQVEDWAEVTTQRLQQAREWLLEETFDFSKLFLSCWQARFAGKQPKPLPKMTYQAFLHTA